ncbi:MAG: ATP-binding protein [Pseudomonadota bacterium]
MNGPVQNIPFLGRKSEIRALRGIAQKDESALTVIYGRRRIGKTRLIEEAFSGKGLIKFEGIEGQPTPNQKKAFLDQLAACACQRKHALMKRSSWIDILILLSEHLGKKKTAVLMDEFQWMAAERDDLVSALKYVWDNHFQKKNNIHLILCGSISSFLVKKVIRSKALYGRVGLEMDLKPLSVEEIKTIFVPQRSCRELVELYMCVGGIPHYLKMIDPSRSAARNMESLCFSPNGLLTSEFERIFASHFGKNRHYKNILMTLAKARFATRDDLMKKCHIQSGGHTSDYLEDLELAGFIESYAPVQRGTSERLNRYRIKDPYLLFYFRFIHPSLRRIRDGRGEGRIAQFVSPQRYAIWQGLAFERFCYYHHQVIADKLGFSAVRYDCGSWYSRKDQRSGAQIDMLFMRADRIITLCEMKFQDDPVGKEVIASVEGKIRVLPNPKKWTIERVLVTASPPTKDLLQEGYFHRILELDGLLA